MEWVTAVPVPQNVPGSSKTPTKSNPSPSGAVKATPNSGKKSHQSAKQVTGLFWGDPERGKEDAEVRKQEDKCRKKPTGPILSLDDHEDSVTDLMKWAALSRVSQLPNKASGSGSKDRGKVWAKHPPTDQSDDEPLSDRADEPKAKSRKRDPTPDLVILEDDDNTPLPRRVKGTGKKARTHTPGEDEGFEVLSNHLKGKAQAIQYNLKLAILTEYRNLHIPNLKGPPNTDDHYQYLSNVKDVSWSYPAKGNIITTRQYFKNLKASKDQEAIEAGDNVLQEKGMLGIPQENLKAGPVKCRYIIFVLCSVKGQIIDALDSDYGRDWNIRLYDIVSLASTRKVEKSGSLIYKGQVVQGKVTYGLYVHINKPPDLKQPHPDAPAPHFGLRDEALLVCDPQLRSHVEACRLPWTHHFGAHRGEHQKEMNTGTYPYFTLIHRLSQPMTTFSHQLYGVVPVISPEKAGWIPT